MNLFNLDPEIIYLNHAAVAPWPTRTVDAVKAFAIENGRWGATDYSRWLETEHRLRNQLAQLINAPSEQDIALLKNTSEGLSIIAYGIDWKKGDNIVSIAQEFPSNRIVWESLRSRGVTLKLLDLPNSVCPEKELLKLCDERTRLVSISSVQYATGLRLDLQAVGRYCRSHGVLFCVDAIQSLGAIPFDVAENLADFVVADGHKWMLGPEGLALFYCRSEIRERLRLHQYGWHMVEHAGDFDRKCWQPADSASRFECGSPNMLGIHALSASLDLLLEQGIDSVQQRIAHLTAYMVEAVDRLGFELLSPRQPERRGGILTFRVPERDNQALQRHLMQQQVICAYRGGGLRFSPHFHQASDGIGQAFERLSGIL
ncbi:MAG: aminotransferase class V-fold PLP-dependent enzyme [Gammaproteobacteria bacterium]|nr:aminotransferase class V-fold PLP-dependent enzyme [Gammaproteobacteria bacterium]